MLNLDNRFVRFKNNALAAMYRALNELKKNKIPISEEEAKELDDLYNGHYNTRLMNNKLANSIIKNRSLIHTIRRSINELVTGDPLSKRESVAKTYGTPTRSDTVYINPEKMDDISGKEDWEHTICKPIAEKGMRFFVTKNSGTTESETFFPYLHWKDDFLRCVRNNDFEDLHDKINHYRIGDEFYSKDYYLLFKGNAYKKTEWAVENAKLINLKKSIKVYTNLYTYPNTSAKFEQYMELENSDEEFVNTSDFDLEGKYYIDLIVGPSSNRQLFSPNFFSTMVRFGKKRLHNLGAYQYIHLSKDMLKCMEVAPTTAHKACYEALKDKLEKWNMRQGLSPDNSRFQRPEDALRTITFKVRYVQSNERSLVSQLIKETLKQDVAYGPLEFKARLEVVQKILKTEDEYELKKRNKNK